MNYYAQAAQERGKTRDVVRYINANGFLNDLKRHQKQLTRQEVKTLRGQALAGDVDGATKGLYKLLERR